MGQSAQLAEEFARLNEFLSGGGGLDAALTRLVHLAVAAVPGCDWAAVTEWPPRREPRSLADSDGVAAEIDRLQYEVGEGPCMEAAADSEAVVAADLTSEKRWPAFTAAALDRSPVRGILAIHLADEPARTALNLYSARPEAFVDETLGTAAVFAAHARVLLLHARTAVKASQLEQALVTSRQIGAAMGILMSDHKITQDQAFDLLRRSSQRLHRKLHDVADEVTETGTLPTD
ncbi:GAF and ANTAR domain-containing protein [Jatrophihabitans fulvus]